MTYAISTTCMHASCKTPGRCLLGFLAAYTSPMRSEKERQEIAEPSYPVQTLIGMKQNRIQREAVCLTDLIFDLFISSFTTLSTCLRTCLLTSPMYVSTRLPYLISPALHCIHEPDLLLIDDGNGPQRPGNQREGMRTLTTFMRKNLNPQTHRVGPINTFSAGNRYGRSNQYLLFFPNPPILLLDRTL